MYVHKLLFCKIMIEPVLYKGYIISFQTTKDRENSEHYGMRKWFILKNIHLTHEYGPKKNTILSFNELHNYSQIYLQMEIYDCTYDDSIMKTMDKLRQNLFV